MSSTHLDADAIGIAAILLRVNATFDMFAPLKNGFVCVACGKPDAVPHCNDTCPFGMDGNACVVIVGKLHSIKYEQSSV